ncbi:hypothetical protein CALVIDRAFT_559608 [Calocera viscosa TUFC12733]|uniref:C2H2-type domain-containing protein n=1 Tax=Calocera viscosa (strain TUFC12733) TaxID=1330018 RepID=A0A167SDK5_CALVF|nr:hypothetical protein CALVIDRAFT_559608 [Calocera viscosa TUFC12733]
MAASASPVVDSPDSPIRKTFDCDKCGSKYSRAEYLRRHARKHENVYPFKCPYPNCTKEFARSDVLLRHRRRQHPDSPLPSKRPSDSPPISPTSPVSPTSLRSARGRRRSSAASTYSAWGEQTVRFTPPPPAYAYPRGSDSPSPPADGDRFTPPLNINSKPSSFSLSLSLDRLDRLDPPALHPHSLPIVPPFQLSAGYSPTSPLYAPSPPPFGDIRLILPDGPGQAYGYLGAGVDLGSWSPASLGGSSDDPLESPYTSTPLEDHALYPHPLHELQGEDMFFPPPPPGPPSLGMDHLGSPGDGGMQSPGQFPFVDLQKLLRERGEYGTVGGP